MADSLINIGELSKPVTVLIEKISNAVGVMYEPVQIKRKANAEAEAKKIHALADIEVQEIQQRALVRFVQEETKKQINIENITEKSFNKINDNAKPENIEDDWISHFFDKCKNISDDEMQELWSKILAGEANQPGSHSKRTVDLLASLDKKDAELFTSFCQFCMMFGNKITPVIFNSDNKIYNECGIEFETLSHLDDIGLIRFDSLGGYVRTGKIPKNIVIYYFEKPINLTFPNDINKEINIGKALLTNIGEEIAKISNAKPNDKFLEYLSEKLLEQKISASCLLEHQGV